MKKTHLILIAILISLSAVWYFTRDVDENREKTFAADFPEIDLNAVHTLKIYAHVENGNEVILYRQGDDWRVLKGMSEAPVHEGRMDVLFTELMNLKPTRLAGISKDDWNELGVTDSLGTRLKLITDEGLVLDMMIGQFQYRDAKKSMVNRAPPGTQNKRGITYVRLIGDEKVYSAEGFFGPNFNQIFETWRNQLLVSIDLSQLQNIEFRYPENSNFSIDVQSDGWYYEGSRINPQSQEIYASLLVNRKHTFFADAFEMDRNPLFQVIYHLADSTEIILDAFEANSGQIIIRSSQNPETFFLDYDDSLLDGLFPPLEFFFNPHVDYKSLS